MRLHARRRRAIVWVATFKDRAQHAHVVGERLCSPVKVMDCAYWQKIKEQPTVKCGVCLDILRRAVETTESQSR